MGPFSGLKPLKNLAGAVSVKVDSSNQKWISIFYTKIMRLKLKMDSVFQSQKQVKGAAFETFTDDEEIKFYDDSPINSEFISDFQTIPLKILQNGT